MRIFNYILIKLLSKQVIEIHISKCVFIWKHKKTTLDIAYKKWERTHLYCIMHTTIPVQHVAYKIFSHFDPFKIWNDQLGHPKGCVKNYWQFFWSWFPQSVDTVSTTGIWIIRSSYLKIRLTLLDSWSYSKEYVWVRYKDCMDSSGISWLYRYIYEMI